LAPHTPSRNTFDPTVTDLAPAPSTGRHGNSDATTTAAGPRNRRRVRGLVAIPAGDLVLPPSPPVLALANVRAAQGVPNLGG
jgi:hypothetical protein